MLQDVVSTVGEPDQAEALMKFLHFAIGKSQSMSESVKNTVKEIIESSAKAILLKYE